MTGRELQDLLAVCPHVELFDRVVAENGALVYWPAKREEKLLGEAPPEPFVSRATRARRFPGRDRPGDRRVIAGIR